MNIPFLKREVTQEEIFEMQAKVQKGNIASEFKKSIFWSAFFNNRIGNKRIIELSMEQAQPINGNCPDPVGITALDSARKAGRIAELIDICRDLETMISDGEQAKKRLDKLEELKK